MGTLYIVATPIGNLEDITIRAIKILFSVDYIACEDTRKTGQLLTLLEKKYTFIHQSIGVKEPKLISFYDEVEEQKIPEILTVLESGKSVALVSDAGTPLISDPGYKLVRACIKAGVPVTSIPGPSAVLTAATLSGFPINTFTFLGYLSEKSKKRRDLFISLQNTHTTFVAFETPHRIAETLGDMMEIFGDIDIVITRELTKMHEEIVRGKISFLLSQVRKLRGELVLLFYILK